ncbi:hypothetical protein [Nocardia camponoti]|uniref:Uncharacterized protein n=1 Tax=Nocardia camponoti TaxID=1616106 RepID=A0A917QUV3_9NOCA|nr:hypothetical protein [Nocardia camponoti]GGK68925.1 hypothetical protein GCM10011591_46300 [Nocardia camponoti]
MATAATGASQMERITVTDSEERRRSPERSSFSATDEVWNAAKTEWMRRRRDYPAWAEWLEAALDEKSARVRAALGVDELEPAPDRLPPGRRTTESGTAGRKRRSFTCTPRTWERARAAWWAQAELYPALTDWIEEAIEEKTAGATYPSESAKSVASSTS